MPADAPGAPELADALLDAARALRRLWSDAAAEHGLAPHQARALRTICAAGQMRPARLAERLRITPRSVTDVVDALADRGLVERGPDPRDRRAQVLVPTQAGLVANEAVGGARAAAAERFFAGLDEPTRRELARLLAGLTGRAGSGHSEP